MEVTRLFTEALNARDVDALAALVADDVELRSATGAALHGREGLEALVEAAGETDLLFARTGAEQVDGSNVTVPMQVVVRRSRLRGSARFEVRDGRITAYSSVTDDGG